MKKKINNIIEKNIEKFINCFIIIQPILDSITALCINYLKMNITIGAIIRISFLILCILYLIFLNETKNRKKDIFFLCLLTCYTIIFSIITIKYKNTSVLIYEIKNTINTFYILIATITILDFQEQYKLKIRLKTILIAFTTYLTLIIIPNLTNTGFLSYSHSKVGKTGWFISANGVGNILSILLPFIIYYILKICKNNYIKIIITICTLYVITTMGTKVPVLSLIICILTNAIFYIKEWIKQKKYKSIMISLFITILLTIIATLTLPQTSFYKNIQIHKDYLGINNYIDVLTDYKLIDHFIFSQRLTFLNNTHKNYKKASPEEKIFGIGYIENYGTDNVSTKTIEIDYFEIFYRNGIIGIILYMYILYFYIIKTKNKKQKGLINIEEKTTIILILLLSLFSGHVLVAPAISIYIAIIIGITKGGIYEKINER
jgi:hypothetical protein